MAALYATGQELGVRPASSLAERAPSDGVRFVEANGLRFAKLEQGEGPLAAWVIAGDTDGAAPLPIFEAAARAFQAGHRYEALETVRHFPQLEAPDAAVASLIIEFLAREGGAEAREGRQPPSRGGAVRSGNQKDRV